MRIMVSVNLDIQTNFLRKPSLQIVSYYQCLLGKIEEFKAEIRKSLFIDEVYTFL